MLGTAVIGAFRRDERASGVTQRVIETRSGERLRVASYRIPEPGYVHKGCGPAADGAAPDDVLRGAWAACLENEHWRAVLDGLCRGLGSRIVAQEALGLDPSSPSGGELRGLIHHCQRLGVLPTLMRACEMRDARSATKFVASMTDPAMREELAELSRSVTKERSLERDREVSKAMRRHGLRLNVDWAGESHLTARRNLRRIIKVSSGFG